MVSQTRLRVTNKPHTMTVLLFPPRAFCNNLVKAESRNGTLTFFPAEFSAKALITLPKLDKLWLMAAPYEKICHSSTNISTTIFSKISY